MTEPTDTDQTQPDREEAPTADARPDRRERAGRAGDAAAEGGDREGGGQDASDDEQRTRRRRRGSRGGRGRSRGQRGGGATSTGEAGGSSEGAGDRASRDHGGADEPDGDDGATREADPAQSDADGADDRSDGSRRRRRGRRGRGRGGAGGGQQDRRGGSASETGQASEERGAGRDAGSKDTGASDRGDRGDGTSDGRSPDAGGQATAGKGPRSKGAGGKGAGGKGAGGKGSGSNGRAAGGASSDGEGSSGQGGAARSKEDEATAEAIAKGGTRQAAKQRGKRGGGGGGNGRGRGSNRPGGVPEEVRRAILEGPPRTMLVTNREDRTQIGVLEDRTVVEHYVTRKKDVTFVGNIYMARVQNVLPGMEAAFLDIGKGRNGVLYAGEVLYDELDLEENADERIENALKPGQKVLVQVTKDPMGSKGPRLTMHLSLAGRYSVLAPNSDLFGISRKLTDRERDRLRKIVKKVKPDEHGVIVRTAAENASEEQLTADLERLLAKWSRVEEAAKDAKALTPVYEEPPLVVKVIRDNFGPEFERCVVDDEDLYHQVRGYLDEVAPELTSKVELYGQPTADARARAAGAPALEDASADPGTADQATVVDDAQEPSDSGPGSGGEDTTDDETTSSDTPAGRTATTGASSAAEGPAAEARAPETAGADAAAAMPVAAADGTVVAATVDLEAARARRETLPRLFDAYDVTEQLRKATSKKVWLPSGGYLIIESTEAMKVIDVNSGKFTGNGDMNLEEVVLRTNLEAADEIVRQLRLRDMGGIIVIDFIDMLLKANQDQVVRRLKRELLRDRTKTRVSEVSRLGLVQMTRKNVSQGLVEAFSHTCEHCEGRGLISELD